MYRNGATNEISPLRITRTLNQYARLTSPAARKINLTSPTVTGTQSVQSKAIEEYSRIPIVLKKVTSRKRLTVFRSNKHLYAQVIDDSVGKTLASASSKEKGIDTNIKDRKSMAEVIGKNIAQRSIEKGVKEVAFDKGKYKYHGLIKILADSARTQGLIF